MMDIDLEIQRNGTKKITQNFQCILIIPITIRVITEIGARMIIQYHEDNNGRKISISKT